MVTSPEILNALQVGQRGRQIACLMHNPSDHWRAADAVEDEDVREAAQRPEAEPRGRKFKADMPQAWPCSDPGGGPQCRL
jgi:hypothetical protein